MYAAIVCFDIDGTLLNEQDHIHPNDVEVLRQPPANVCLMPASGRTLTGVRGMFKRHGLFTDQRLPFPAITQNGAACYSAGEQLEHVIAFPKAIQAQLLEWIDLYPEVCFFLSSPDRMLMANPSDFGYEGAGRYSFIVEPYQRQLAADLPLCKLMCLSERHFWLEDIEEKAENMQVEHAFSMPTILEFTPLGATKGSGVKAMQAALHLEDLPIYAVGDGSNDLPLFAQAKRTFAPSTSPKAIRAQADDIIDRAGTGIFAPILAQIG